MKLRALLPSTIVALATGISLSLLIGPAASAVDYKEYKRSRKQTEYFELSIVRETVTITVFDDGSERSRTFSIADIVHRNDATFFDESVTLNRSALIYGDDEYPYVDIYDIVVTGEKGRATITFYKSAGKQDRTSRTRRGNLIEFDRNVVIAEDDFVRGILFTVRGDIEIYGEVNRDVVSLFGEIHLGPGAVTRGDLATLTSRIDIAPDASVYGEVYSGKKQKATRRRRFYRRPKAFTLYSMFRYNRVDGARLDFGIKHESDSTIPTMWASGGYAFASKRSRYDFGLEQMIWREASLSIGGSVYRRLASDDDWLLDDKENLVYTLIATEDFKDYYEAEGGQINLKAEPFKNLKIEVGYRNESTNWLRAHPHLWSLFGGDKLFSDNFGTVDRSFRTPAIGEIDTTTNTYLSFTVALDTRNRKYVYKHSAWHLVGDFEWSHKDIRSDFDYRRYALRLARYQEVNRRAMLKFSATAGFSDGYLPMYKRYYLGGLGTLRGYYHKEFMGSRFWMANAEYRIDLPRTVFAVAIFWDGGQIANDAKLTRDIEVKQNLGLAVHMYDAFKISLAHRLDGSSRSSTKIYVRFGSRF